jgi:hypothetical protein
MPSQYVDFRTMIHKIHSGDELPYKYSIDGFGGTVHNYNEVAYPACSLMLAEFHSLPFDPGFSRSVPKRDDAVRT